MTFREAYGKISNDIQMNLDESLKLYNCASLLPENAVIVEIGTYKGGSAVLMAAASEDKKGMVYTIDIDPKIKSSFLDNIQFITGDSEEISRGWTKEIDMLLIDGDHLLEGINKDIRNWVPKVKAGGLICFHDYGSRIDVTTAINEMLVLRKGLPNHSLLTIIK